MFKYVVYLKQLPKPVQLSTYVYLGSLIAYNAGGTWLDAKNKLIQYRNGKLSDDEKIKIKDDWEAVTYGANKNFLERFLNSIIWPVKTVTNFIPFLVLNLNPPINANDKTNNKTDVKSYSADKEN